MDTSSDAITPPLQDINSRPVLMGADVSAFYPSIDIVSGAQLAAEAVLQAKVEFKDLIIV